MLYVLDSTVLIDFLRGRPVVGRISALHHRGETLATTAVNVEEICRGLRESETRAAESLFAGLVVLPIDHDAGWLAGQWRREFSSRGVTLWQADCLIAAATRIAGGVLITGNPRDFPMMAIEHWPVGQ